MSIIKITKDNYDNEVISSNKPVLVDFWADWCGPCRMLTPILEEVATEQDSVTIAKVNVDEESELARQFKIMSIPTLVLIKDGQVVAKEVGLLSKAKLLELINK